MVNTGKPSLACHLCRKRRVKCDLTQPGCMRCLRFGTACPGYRHEQDLLFHNESQASYLKGQPKDRRKRQNRTNSSSYVNPASPLTTKRRVPLKPEPPTPNPLSSPNSCLAVTKPSQNKEASCNPRNYAKARFPPLVVLSRPLRERYSDHSIPLLLSRFSAPAEGRRCYYYLDFLPDVYRETSENSCLKLATDVVAQTLTSNLFGPTVSSYELADLYGKALRSTNSALQDPNLCASDDTILAVWFLGIHGMLIGRFRGDTTIRPHQWEVHSMGISSLLRLRGHAQFATRRGRHLFWMMYGNIVMRCLVANEEPPPESHEWLQILGNDMQEYDELFLVVYYYALKANDIVLRIRQAMNHGTIEEAMLIAPIAFKETAIIDNYITRWSNSPAFTQCMEAAHQMGIYLWNLYRGVRCKLHRYLLLLSEHIRKHGTQEPDPNCLSYDLGNSVTILKTMGAEMLETASYILNGAERFPMAVNVASDSIAPCWADALRLLWPMAVVSVVPQLTAEQRQKGQAVLEQLGHELGIRQALCLLDVVKLHSQQLASAEATATINRFQGNILRYKAET